jgi:hypothetical protein
MLEAIKVYLVLQVLQFVRMSLQSRKVNLLSVNKPGPSTDEHNLFVDESLQEFTVSVSGANPEIGLMDPEGKPVEGPPKLTTVLSLQNIKAVNVMEPEPGQWKVKIVSDSEHSVRSTGLSDVDFNFGFSAVVTNKMEETYHRPLKGKILCRIFLLITYLMPLGLKYEAVMCASCIY